VFLDDMRVEALEQALGVPIFVVQGIEGLIDRCAH
jgi:hypothetical protein